MVRKHLEHLPEGVILRGIEDGQESQANQWDTLPGIHLSAQIKQEESKESFLGSPIYCQASL